jgi:23S rRNA pseudoU1915 N3-methylase RlmH
MKITLLCISDSDKHFASAIAEYEKRLGKQFTITNLKPVKHGSREQIIQKETQKISDKLQALRLKQS